MCQSIAAQRLAGSLLPAATQHGGNLFHLDALDRCTGETADVRQVVEPLGEGVDADHAAGSSRRLSSVDTEASSTRRPTYTRSTSATASVKSPVSTMPLLSTRSTRS